MNSVYHNVGSSGSRLVKPVRDKRLTSVADTRQTFKRLRKELTDNIYHKGNQWDKLHTLINFFTN